MSPQDRHRLRRLGETDASIDALEHLWNNGHVGYMFHPKAAMLRTLGISLADTYDLLAHHVWRTESVWCIKGGFTPHQAAVIDRIEPFKTNLFGKNNARPSSKVHEMITMDIPVDYKFNALRVAKSATEARRLFTDYHKAAQRGTSQTVLDEKAASIAMLAAMLPAQQIECPCTR